MKTISRFFFGSSLAQRVSIGLSFFCLQSSASAFTFKCWDFSGHPSECMTTNAQEEANYKKCAGISSAWSPDGTQGCSIQGQFLFTGHLVAQKKNQAPPTPQNTSQTFSTTASNNSKPLSNGSGGKSLAAGNGQTNAPDSTFPCEDPNNPDQTIQCSITNPQESQNYQIFKKGGTNQSFTDEGGTVYGDLPRAQDGSSPSVAIGHLPSSAIAAPHNNNSGSDSKEDTSTNEPLIPLVVTAGRDGNLVASPVTTTNAPDPLKSNPPSDPPGTASNASVPVQSSTKQANSSDGVNGPDSPQTSTTPSEGISVTQTEPSPSSDANNKKQDTASTAMNCDKSNPLLSKRAGCDVTMQTIQNAISLHQSGEALGSFVQTAQGNMQHVDPSSQTAALSAAAKAQSLAGTLSMAVGLTDLMEANKANKRAGFHKTQENNIKTHLNAEELGINGVSINQSSGWEWFKKDNNQVDMIGVGATDVNINGSGVRLMHNLQQDHTYQDKETAYLSALHMKAVARTLVENPELRSEAATAIQAGQIPPGFPSGITSQEISEVLRNINAVDPKEINNVMETYNQSLDTAKKNLQTKVSEYSTGASGEQNTMAIRASEQATESLSKGLTGLTNGIIAQNLAAKEQAAIAALNSANSGAPAPAVPAPVTWGPMGNGPGTITNSGLSPNGQPIATPSASPVTLPNFGPGQQPNPSNPSVSGPVPGAFTPSANNASPPGGGGAGTAGGVNTTPATPEPEGQSHAAPAMANTPYSGGAYASGGGAMGLGGGDKGLDPNDPTLKALEAALNKDKEKDGTGIVAYGRGPAAAEPSLLGRDSKSLFLRVTETMQDKARAGQVGKGRIGGS